jgi:hypothetical protein
MGVYNRFPLKMMELDSAQAKKEREKAYQKAYRVANAAYFKAYRKSASPRGLSACFVPWLNSH